VFKGWKFWYC